MNIKDIYKEFEYENFDTEIKAHYLESKESISSTEKKFLEKKIACFKKNTMKETMDAIVLLAIWEPDIAIKEARQKGVFSYRTYQSNENKVLKILEFLNSKKSILQFNPQTLKYLQMKRELSWMYDYYMKAERKIVKEIRKHHHDRLIIKRGNSFLESALFKELFVYIEYVFYKNTDSDVEHDHTNKDYLKSYGNEELANAVSYLIFLYDKTIGIKTERNYFIDVNYVQSSDIERLILSSCKLIQIKEWELLIDYLDYEVQINQREIEIFSSQNHLQESIELGFIKRNMQELLFRRRFEEEINNAMSIEKTMEIFIDKLADEITKDINDGELSRYTFE